MRLSGNEIFFCIVIIVAAFMAVIYFVRRHERQSLIKKLMIEELTLRSVAETENILKAAWQENMLEDHDIITIRVLTDMYKSLLLSPKGEFLFFIGTIMRLPKEIFNDEMTRQLIVANMIVFGMTRKILADSEGIVLADKYNIKYDYVMRSFQRHMLGNISNTMNDIEARKQHVRSN